MTGSRPPRPAAALPRVGGFTLIEMTVALAILAGLSITVFTVLNRSQALQTRAIALAELRSQTRIALDRVAREVREAKLGSVYPGTAKPSCDTSIRFSRPVAGSPTSTAIVYETVEIRMQPTAGETDGNGADDNKNGLIDENDLVFVAPSGATSLIVFGVPDLNPSDAQATTTHDDTNGLDDDGDSILNEGNGIQDEPGAWFAWDSSARSVSMGLSLSRRIKTGEVLSWSEETAVFLRNK